MVIYNPNTSVNPEMNTEIKENLYIWIDILGFSADLESNKFNELIGSLQEFRKAFVSIDSIQCKIISDGLLIILQEPHKVIEVINKIKQAQKDLIIRYQLFIRGGIALGLHYDNNNKQQDDWFLGSGIARAVRVESKDICWPVVGTTKKYKKDIINYCKKFGHSNRSFNTLFNKGYNDRGEEIFFIDFLENDYNFYSIIVKKYQHYLKKKGQGHHRVLAKYRWLLRYYHYKFNIPTYHELTKDERNGIY